MVLATICMNGNEIWSWIMSDLVTCPWCRGPVTLGWFAETPNINCPSCKYERDFYGMTEAEAIAAWNTRAPVKVKPLVWECYPQDDHKTAIGAAVYSIYDRGANWGIDRFGLFIGNTEIAASATEDFAKLVAQADHERRVLGELE